METVKEILISSRTSSSELTDHTRSISLVLTLRARLLYTYLVSCRGPLSHEDKNPFTTFLREELRKAGGDVQLSERWGLTVDEITSLRNAVA